MEEAARKLHQKAQTCIERIEIRFRAWQMFNKPLFYIFVFASWLFTTIAAGFLLDIVAPRLETGWFVKAILILVGAFIYLAIFILAFGKRKKRGFLFWYPWSVVFILTIGIIFLQGRQSYTEEQFSQILAATNSLNSASTASFLFESSVKKDQFADLQKQFADFKHDSAAEKSDLKMDVIEANRERDTAKEELTFFEANPERLSNIYSNIFANAPKNLEEFDLAYGQFTNAIAGATFSQAASLELWINDDTNLIRSEAALHSQFTISNYITLKDRKINFQIFNLSKYQAINSFVDIQANIDPTNIVANGWRQLPQNSEGRNCWRYEADVRVPLFSTWEISTIEILTNFTDRSFYFQIDIGADNAENKTYFVYFTLQ